MTRPKPTRKALGAWYTPPDLSAIVAEHVVADVVEVARARGWAPGRKVRVLDPACGDGRLLDALRVRLHLAGHGVEAVGCDVDADALAAITHPAVRTLHADALTHDWGDDRFDVVVGNPPFLSQMATETTRGGSSSHGGGPYANAAAEFLSLAVRLARPEGSAIGLILPQSILAARDAGPVRDAVDAAADHTWSWWQRDQRRLFEDAAVNVVALGFRRPRRGPAAPFEWTAVVTDQLGVPRLDPAAMATDGTIADRADLNTNFRDEYYALVPAVADRADGPPFLTSGLIDPGRSLWGERPVTFAKRTFSRPRVDLAALEGRFADWATRKLVPKVLVANQTRVVEAVADVEGAWIPGVPITSITPRDPDAGATTVREIEALLTSPVASAWCWHAGGGTGLTSTSIRVSPAILGQVPWPAGDLGDAVDRLAAGDVVGCGRSVVEAFAITGRPATTLVEWWADQLPVRD